jgi:hypothetical protein
MAISSPGFRQQNDLSNYPTAISCSLAGNSPIFPAALPLDIAIATDGPVYVYATDTFGNPVLRLMKGAAALELYAADQKDAARPCSGIWSNTAMLNALGRDLPSSLPHWPTATISTYKPGEPPALSGL